MSLSADTEIVFEQKVVDLAHMFGWKVMGIRPAGTNKGFRTPIKYDGKGWPDLTLIHPNGHIIFAEMKRDVGSSPYTPEQAEWGETLIMCSERVNLTVPITDRRVHYAVWKPRHGDEIARLLSFGRVTEWRP